MNKMLKEEDCLRVIYQKQLMLQERLGRLSKARNSNMQEKAQMIKEEMFDIQKELGEMIEHLPFKYWKSYSSIELSDWTTSEQREKALEEYIDAFHFFLNIGLILNFSIEEIYLKYINKNKENHDRQDRGY